MSEDAKEVQFGEFSGIGEIALRVYQPDDGSTHGGLFKDRMIVSLRTGATSLQWYATQAEALALAAVLTEQAGAAA